MIRKSVQRFSEKDHAQTINESAMMIQIIALERRHTMAVQSNMTPGGLAKNFWVQMVVLAIVTVIVVALAARYLW